MIGVVSGKLVARFIFHSTPSGTGNLLEATLRRLGILVAARRGEALRFVVADEISRTKDRASLAPLTRQAVDLVREKVYAHEKPGPGYIIGKDVNGNKILFASHGWPSPSDADYAFIELCSKRLHARMSATIEPAGAVL
jgi:hypothetical protein